MTEDEINEGWKVIGDKLRETIDIIRDNASAEFKRASVIEDAWDQKDYPWLNDNGILHDKDMDLIQTLCFHFNEGLTHATIKEEIHEGHVKLLVSCRWKATPLNIHTYWTTVPESLDQASCFRVGFGMLFENSWDPDIKLQVRFERDGEVIQEWS